MGLFYNAPEPTRGNAHTAWLVRERCSGCNVLVWSGGMRFPAQFYSRAGIVSK